MKDIAPKPKPKSAPAPASEPGRQTAVDSEPDLLVIDTPAAPETVTRQVWWKKWQWQLGIGLVVVAALGSGVAWLLTSHSKPVAIIPAPSPSASPTPTPTPATKASPLTGLPVAPELADRPITGVVIENFDPDARPQSGLSQAGVVYEALAEGGITRFEAFFLDQTPAVIGPVRSVRTYFVDWALEFNAPLAHAGGNIDALDEIGPLGMKNIEGLSIGAPTFYRTTDRYAPHNFYTGTSQLDAEEAKLGYNTPSNFTVSPRKADQPTQTPTHPAIHIDYSYNGYQVDYKYDPSTNDYARSLGGTPHIDRNTGAQIHVKNVVVEYMPTSYGFTRLGEQTVIMQTVGTGKTIVFRDGGAVEGTWSKASHSARTQLLDANGTPIPLDDGNTWYSIVPTTKTVSY